MNVRSESIPMLNDCDTVVAKKFVFTNVPLINVLKPVDTVEIRCSLNKRKDGSYWASICQDAFNCKGKLLTRNDYNPISWERLLRCEDLKKNSLFRELFILHEFDDCCGMCHNGFDENKNHIMVNYVLTNDTVSKLLTLLK